MYDRTLKPSALTERLNNLRDTLKNDPPTTKAEVQEVMEQTEEVVTSFKAYDHAGLDVTLQHNYAEQAYDTLDELQAFDDAEKRREAIQNVLGSLQIEVPYTDEKVENALTAAQEDRMASESAERLSLRGGQTGDE